MWANMQQTLMPTDPNQRATTLKKRRYRNQCHLSRWKNSETKLKMPKIILEKNSGANNSNLNINVNNDNNNNNSNKNINRAKKAKNC